MNKNELFDTAFKYASEQVNGGISQKAGKAMFEAVFGTIAAALANGEDVSLAGFGCFKIVSREERQCRNPRTGEAMTIPARKAVRFFPFSRVKNAVKK